MKKLICLLLIFACFSGCTPTPKTDEFSVVATIFPAYDFARSIVGEEGSVTMLLPPGGEVHGFEPTLQDLNTVRTCDVFIYNGGESDSWVEELLRQCDTSHMQIIRMMDHVDLLTVAEEHHHQNHHHQVEEGDEHIWTTPDNALLIANAIYRGLIASNREKSQQFQQNFNRLQSDLVDLQRAFLQLHDTSGQTLVFADRFPFLYLTTAYDLHYVAAFSGCTSNTEAPLKTLAELKEKAEGSSFVLCTEFSDGRLAQTVSDGVDAKVLRLHSCHNVTKEEWQNGVTYLDLMNHNLTVLKEVLNK